MTDNSFDELIDLLTQKILEQSRSPEQANYYVNGVILRLTNIDWTTKIAEVRKKQHAWLEALHKLNEQAENELVHCAQCNKQMRQGDSIRLQESPKYRHETLCPECAYRINQALELKRNQRFAQECALCDVTYETFSPRNSLGLCTKCYSESNQRELNRLNSHLRRAQQLGLPATLTLREWLRTIDEFGGLCAYCQRHHYEVMEHYVPLSRGGGTTAANCVPACKECNSRKHQKHPKDVIVQFEQLHMLRIRRYLEICETVPK